MWHYARGLALAARHDVVRRGATSSTACARLPAQVKDDVIIILNPAPALLEAGRRGAGRRDRRAAAAFRRGGRAPADGGALEDALTYDEPPPWYHSVRNVLGWTLLAAGRAAERPAAFREDLRVVRETGWSLAGLERALRARRGTTREAEERGAALQGGLEVRRRVAMRASDGEGVAGRA